MNDLGIKINYTSSKSIKIAASITTNDICLTERIFMSESEGHIFLSCDIPINTPTFINLYTSDSEIYHNPVFVTSIEIDNFYNLKNLAYTGTNTYDVNFLNFIKSNNICVENQSDNNCLFFTGKLTYIIISPISGFIFGKKQMLI